MNILHFICIVTAALCLSSVLHASTPLATPTLDGKWEVTLWHKSFGMMRIALDFETAPDGRFQAYSHRRGVKNLQGGFKASAAKLFSSKPMLRSGALCGIEKGHYTTEGDTITFFGQLYIPMATMDIQGRIQDGKIQARLLEISSNKQVGGLDGSQAAAAHALDDYPAIARELMAQYNQRIYDRRVLQTKEWEKFASRMNTFAHKAQDDLDMISAFYTYSSPLPFSHKVLYRVENSAAISQDGPPASSLPNMLALQEVSPATAVLRVRSFRVKAQEMDSMLQIVLDKGYENLVVDIRGNSGGSLEGGITLGSYLAERETPTGVYLTQKWFNTHPAPPTAAEIDAMPAFTQASYSAFTRELEEKGIVVLKARPGGRRFEGKLFLLIDRRSASACEPLAWSLKHYGRATLVGEPTAGQMLSAASYPLRSGFVAVIPNADYYAPDGSRLDFVGVKPHIEVKSEEALDVVLRSIGEK